MENVYESPKSDLGEVINEPTRKTRLFHFLVDFVLLFPCVGVVYVPVIWLMPPEMYSQVSNVLYAENNVAITGWSFFSIYYIFFESIFGKTPAKFITKTKVVSRSGRKPNILQILARTVVRILPFEALTFLFGKYSPYGLHDFFSYTRVVRVKNA